MCLLALLSLLVSSPRPSSADRFTHQYDDAIKDSVRKFGADYPDWRDWKAQLFQESRLDTTAVSPVGARGLCQAMPATFADWARDLKWGEANPHIAKYCIQGGQYYMAQLRRFWKTIAFPDRQDLAKASYNAGAGNIRKAQRRCGNPSTYGQIVACLAAVTGPANARQTTEYVTRIAKWRAMMEAER